MSLFNSASAGDRQQLVRAEQVSRVECGPQPNHGIEITGFKHLAHETDLLDANAVFASHTTATIQALLQDLGTGRQYALRLLLITFVEEQDRVYVTVTGVENVDDANVVLATDFGDAAEHVWKSGPRHHAILRTVAGA